MANNVPNFDAMTCDELMIFWSRYHRPSRKDAEALVGDRRRGFTNIAAKLANYACNKAVAMGCRLDGNIESALIYDECADMCYEDLPSDVKW
jgi:hypothetical protein